MIHVDKSSVATPQILIIDNAKSDGEKHMAIDYYENGIGSEIDYKLYKRDAIKTTLEMLFKKKCAYCESFITFVTAAHIEHWRPKAKVTDYPLHKGYYWLASEWDNLLLACPTCNSSFKKNWFPIRKTSRYALTSQQNLSIEQPLLINPCIEPNPSRHFTFYKQGGIEGLTRKGKCSVIHYGLDREDLIIQRSKTAREVIKHLEAGLYNLNQQRKAILDELPLSYVEEFHTQAKWNLTELQVYCQEDYEYSAMSKQIIKFFYTNTSDKTFRKILRSLAYW